MHLINTSSLELHEFLNDDQLPPYAILSHTWEQQEVSFHDMQHRKEQPHVTAMKGYDKIARCCQQAFQSGLEWAWVDTCCIDKSSSAALSEAINAMYRWYKNAAVCYAYLSDITSGDYKIHGLGRSRWFTRGWTLQELIAPKTLVFFSATWKKLSTKHRLQHKLEAITGVPRPFLLGHEDVSEASIAMRMSWAARRETSRLEDVAYCLLGLFDINMPLIYGEGEKAFQRLQEEIIRVQPYDHTIYAWGSFTILDKDPLPKEFAGLEDLGVDPAVFPCQTEMQWDEKLAKPLLGLLARSPADFDGCGRFISTEESRIQTTNLEQLAPPRFMHDGIRIELPVVSILHPIAVHLSWPPIIQLRDAFFVRLFVEDTNVNETNWVVFPLINGQMGAVGRMGSGLIMTAPLNHVYRTEWLFVAPQSGRGSWSKARQSGDIVFRWRPRSFFGDQVVTRTHWICDQRHWEMRIGDQTINRSGSTHSGREVGFGWIATWQFKKLDARRFWAIVLHRVPGSRRKMGCLAISLVRALAADGWTAEDIEGHPWQPWPLLFQRPLEAVQQLACDSHVMSSDEEVWRPSAEGLPKGIALCVESMWDTERKVQVDVVDFRYPDGPDDEYMYVPMAD